MKKFLLPLVMLPLLVGACDQSAQNAEQDISAETENAPSNHDAWLGRWNGVEGTYLDLARNEDTGGYAVTIANLDGPRTFYGESNADGIGFERDGKMLTIVAGNGEDTGMKWLADRQDCLVVDANEGYCRD